VKINSTILVPFMIACSIVEKLIIHNINSTKFKDPQKDIGIPDHFPRLKTLFFRSTEKDNKIFPFILSRAIDIEILKVYSYDRFKYMAEYPNRFIEGIMATSLDRLKRITLLGTSFRNEETLKVLNRLSEPIEMIKCKFSDGSFEVFVEKFSNTIRVVDFSGFCDVKSSMVQQVLINFSALEEFRGGLIRGTDLVEFRISHSNGGKSPPTLSTILGDDWKCLNLKILQLYFDLRFTYYTKNKDKEVLPEMDKILQQHIFRQLSRLELLEVLDLGGSSYRCSYSLDCRFVSSGGYLEELKPLKKLRTLVFPNGYSCMVGLEEVNWMKKNWGKQLYVSL
jgi:hypothetical protein